MSDIVERARDRAGMLPSVDHVESALLLEAAAEIERLRANADRQYAELVRDHDELGGLLHRAEAQSDALLKAAEPIIAESSREDRDDYRVRVKTADIRALAAAVAGARPAEGK